MNAANSSALETGGDGSEPDIEISLEACDARISDGESYGRKYINCLGWTLLAETVSLTTLIEIPS